MPNNGQSEGWISMILNTSVNSKHPASLINCIALSTKAWYKDKGSREIHSLRLTQLLEWGEDMSNIRCLFPEYLRVAMPIQLTRKGEKVIHFQEGRRQTASFFFWLQRKKQWWKNADMKPLTKPRNEMIYKNWIRVRKKVAWKCCYVNRGEGWPFRIFSEAFPCVAGLKHLGQTNSWCGSIGERTQWFIEIIA